MRPTVPTLIGAPLRVTTGAPSCFTRPKAPSRSRTERDGTGILYGARDGLEVRLRYFNDLDAARNRWGPADLVAQARIGQAEHCAQLRIRVGGGRLALELETDRFVECDRFLEIRDDRAEIVARAHYEASRRRCSRGLGVRQTGRKDHHQNEHQSFHLCSPVYPHRNAEEAN
jgi:hypothetical protein